MLRFDKYNIAVLYPKLLFPILVVQRFTVFSKIEI